MAKGVKIMDVIINDIINDLEEMVLIAKYHNENCVLKVSSHIMQMLLAQMFVHARDNNFRYGNPNTFCGMPIQVDFDLKGYRAYIMKVIDSRFWGKEDD